MGITLTLLGFGTTGIVAGSVAAGIQAAIGSVAAGSAFAVLTSLGMQGIFATSAIVELILGAGGLAAYISKKFDPKKDAELIKKTIQEHDNFDIIVKLLEFRHPKEREQIEINFGQNFHQDIINYAPEEKKAHVENLLRHTNEIEINTLIINTILNDQTLDIYLEKKFDVFQDISLICNVIIENDNPLIIVRIIEYRKPNERKKINENYKSTFGLNKRLIDDIIEFIRPEHPEANYLKSLIQ